MIKGLVKTLKSSVHSPLHFSLLTETPDYDFNRFHFDVCRAVYERGRGKLKPVLVLAMTLLWALIWRLTGLKAYFCVPRRGQDVLKEYVKANVVVSRGADVFNDVYGIQSVCLQSYYILLSLILKKPVILCGHAIGPFSNRLVALYVGKLFNKASLITVRDRASEGWLKNVGVVRPPVKLTADLAFLMEPAPIGTVEKILGAEGIEIKKPMVGLNVSQLISRWVPGNDFNKKYTRYVALMARTADFLVDVLHAKVVLVPHVTHPDMDDREVAKDVMNLTFRKNAIQMIKEDYSSDELKGIIGYFDLFIGARMHSVIAALSTGVPALAIAYSPKGRGIMEMLQQEKWVWDIQTMNYEVLTSKILGLWMNRQNIKRYLTSKNPLLNHLAQLNGKLFNNFLVSNFKNLMMINGCNCTSCGTCTFACPQNAISRARAKYRL